MCKFMMEIERRPEEAKGFVLVKRRGVVERTFGWLGRWRRLRRITSSCPTVTKR
jgi:putative transposase